VLVLGPKIVCAESVGYLFTSFRGSGDGLHLAYSKDGYHWSDLNRTFLAPTVGGKLMRDPHILRATNGVFHMVWTTGWRDNGIGYASSTNLIDWPEQRYLAFMQNVAGTSNCWAPETFFDRRGGQYLITWSSSVFGRFTEAESPDRMNNRTYFVTTKDFQKFSEPKVLLDPGFDHIDTTLIERDGKCVAVFKAGDMQARKKWGAITAAVAETPLGPYKVDPIPIVVQRAEGPALVTIGGTTLLYVDYYTEHRYGAFATTDWKTWKEVTSSTSPVPGQRHGTILTVPMSVIDGLVGPGR